MKIYKPLMFQEESDGGLDDMIYDFFYYTNAHDNPTQIITAIFYTDRVAILYVHENDPNKVMLLNTLKINIRDIAKITHFTKYDLSRMPVFNKAYGFTRGLLPSSSENSLLNKMKGAIKACGEDLTQLTEMIELYTL